ncbi:MULTISPECIES: hypothetical protein [Polaromonas]|uniref:Uncharacterized protein n=1 Tax=Polaromonas aquatica TaxID=332657 RepID=A0ABW1TSH1_9BURK
MNTLAQPLRSGKDWDEEVERYEFSQDDLSTVDAVDWPEELDLYRAMADNDPKFEDHWCEWEDFIYQNWLFLALEQSCHGGILLPPDQRAIRLQSCPEATLGKLRWLFELCPVHVKAHLALRWYWLMRIDRARRTGNPMWQPMLFSVTSNAALPSRPSNV